MIQINVKNKTSRFACCRACKRPYCSSIIGNESDYTHIQYKNNINFYKKKDININDNILLKIYNIINKNIKVNNNDKKVYIKEYKIDTQNNTQNDTLNNTKIDTQIDTEKIKLITKLDNNLYNIINLEIITTTTTTTITTTTNT
jgi:hypothetical protein